MVGQGQLPPLSGPSLGGKGAERKGLRIGMLREQGGTRDVVGQCGLMCRGVRGVRATH